MSKAPISEIETGEGNKQSKAIEIAGLDKWYGKFHALKNIELSVATGQRVVLCGPSGSGKSTLVRCVGQLEGFQGGTIRVFGKRLDGLRQDSSRGRPFAGMVFQQFNLFPHLTVLGNCTLALRRVLKQSAPTAREIALHHLDKVKVREQAQKFPAQLSGGQQQRVAIARALCLEPRIMLFDEPTSALDPEMVKEVLDVMTDLAKGGMTMVCVTHEPGFARAIADEVVLMDEGRIVEVSPPDVFFAAPKQERTRQFLAKVLQ
ncbi:glutamine ABC transporter ATP-binding protein [Mesorhizobium erdmanii]|uniref:Glutamine ABC transporter ATP-binding protein n=2 Tax=Mesorhizobium TaxID=68287 RepID=A0A3M9X3A1_9HYPH|nr:MULTISPECIES: amino acid ABC transporter ATP-binding protein [Mesorhizobium]RNJ42321.1 glutamine ABC transporter ATP-binding protein [Mesorhizobium japonicum]RXT37413.1 glutamine ABC transporter ATP-binding protein [Mesorhizobium erdmanii]